MSATNKTTYYDLPVFIGTDTPSWLGDWNNTMNALDGAINGVKTSADNALSVANTAENKSDTNTETITALNAEVQTIKEAVMNYDQILDFAGVNLAITTNNLDNSSAYMCQNTNKTLSRLFINAHVKTEIDQLISYNYNSGSGTNTWVDLFTVEDNCFNLTQGSQPSVNNALTIGPLSWYRTGEVGVAMNPRFLRAWFDGATTHFGMDIINASLTYIYNSYIWGEFCVFLTGSIYNPVNPSEE